MPTSDRRDFSHSNNPAFDCSAGVVLIPFGRQSYLPRAVEAYGGVSVDLGETTDRIVHRLASPSGPLTLVYSGMGGPAVANALEMVGANGARRVVLVGACGGVDASVAVGDVLVVTGAVRGEGTSRYYADLAFPAVCDHALTQGLWSCETLRGSRRHLGIVFTTDASYRQGPEVYEAFDGMLLGVESECATAAVVARRLGLELAAVLFCTDTVRAAERPDRVYRGPSEPVIRSAFDAALGAAVELLAGV